MFATVTRPVLDQVVPKYHDTKEEGSKHHQEKKSGVRFIVLPSSHDKSMPYSMRNVKVNSMREIELSHRCGRFWYAPENYIDCNTVAKRIKVIELVPGLLWKSTSFSSFRFLSTFLHQYLPYLGFHRLGWAVTPSLGNKGHGKFA